MVAVAEVPAIQKSPLVVLSALFVSQASGGGYGGGFGGGRGGGGVPSYGGGSSATAAYGANAPGAARVSYQSFFLVSYEAAFPSWILRACIC